MDPQRQDKDKTEGRRKLKQKIVMDYAESLDTRCFSETLAKLLSIIDFF